MRERDNSTPRTKRTPIVTKSGGGAARISGGTTLRGGISVTGEPGELNVAGEEGRVEQRSEHRAKRPPPLPSRKAHKIKRIKSQRSTPWAALEPEVRMRQLAGQPPDSSPMAASAAELADMPMHAFGATTLIRRETQLINAERERAERERAAQRHRHQTLPLEQPQAFPGQVAPVVARPASDEGPDRRWLVLLKVGRDELAGIWDGSLESCEPSVWRPATKTWAPLFEVPQIATLVTATVKQRQANPRASVPASPAPRRPQSSAVLASGGRRSSVPPAPGQLRSALASLPDSATSGSNAASVRHDTLRPSSLAELGGTSPELSPAARLTMRAPYIPPPPRVPNLVTARLPVQPAYTEDSESGTVPAYAVATLRQPYTTAPSYAPAPYGAEQYDAGQPYNAAQSYRTAHAHQAAQAFAAAEEGAQPSYSETRAIPLTRRLDADAEPFPQYPLTENSFTPADAVYSSLHSQPAADSYAPHAHSITPLTPPRPATLTERAGWLFAGVAAALLLTTFTGLSSSMREGLAGWVEPKPGSLLASALLSSDQQASATASGAAESPSEAAEAQAKREQAQAQAKEAAKRDDTRTVSVDDLPMLTKSGRLVSSDSSKGKDRADESAESSRESHASAGGRAHSRQGVLTTSSSVKLSSLPHSGAPTEQAASSAPARPASKPQELKFDATAARRALASAVGRAQFCSGERARGTILVTFAPAGGVASVSIASIEGPDVRKGCVVNAFKGARIMPFHGDPVTVQKSFQLR